MNRCEECGKKFATKAALYGHKGGAHGRMILPIRHGTQWGYEKHLKLGETPCESCREAHALHNRQGRKVTIGD